MNKSKKNEINQALYHWYRSVKKSKPEKDFVKRLSEKGWYEVSHNNKICLLKGDTVAKVAVIDPDTDFVSFSRNIIRREYEQSIVAPNNLKKHLPKIYTYHRGLVLQERIKVCSKEYCIDARNLVYKYSIPYGINNHGHNRSGVVKFLTWVYRRERSYVNDNFIDLSHNILEDYY